MDSNDLNKESKMGLLPLFTVANMESDFRRAGPFKNPWVPESAPSWCFCKPPCRLPRHFVRLRRPLRFERWLEKLWRQASRCDEGGHTTSKTAKTRRHAPTARRPRVQPIRLRWSLPLTMACTHDQRAEHSLPRHVLFRRGRLWVLRVLVHRVLDSGATVCCSSPGQRATFSTVMDSISLPSKHRLQMGNESPNNLAGSSSAHLQRLG